jgi:glucosylceramidase
MTGTRRTPRIRLSVAALAAAAVAVVGLPPSAAAQDAAAGGAAPGGSIDFADRRQPIDGFGFSMAFQRAALLDGLVPPDQTVGITPENRDEMVDLMFNRETGAGLSILRLGIGSSAERRYDLMYSIQPADPGGPAAPPQYAFDGYDGGQLWLAKQAQRYGVERFYADAWSPPAYMKTNLDENNGGQLCGLPGTDCPSGDWRQAYADYLVRYARFYAEAGVDITDLNFTNEPDLAVSYASMQITPAQAVDFLKVLGPTVQRSELKMNVVCCDGSGWNQQAEYSAAIEADKAADKWVDIHAGHPYVSPITGPLPTDNSVWMSEWQPNGTAWTETWDDGTGWDAITLAEHIHNTLTVGNANAYIYWFAASRGATRAFLQFDGADYHVAKRLWAMAAYSRFIRPGAHRVEATAADPALKVTAYRNADGSGVIEILNTATDEVATSLDLLGPRGQGQPTTYLTDETHSLASTGTASVDGRTLSVRLPARSLTTVVFDH